MKRSMPLLCALMLLGSAHGEAAENCDRLPARAKQKCLDRTQQIEPRTRSEIPSARTNQGGGPAATNQGRPSTSVGAAPSQSFGATPASAGPPPAAEPRGARAATPQAAPRAAASTPVQPNSAGTSLRAATSSSATSNASRAKPATTRSLGRTTTVPLTSPPANPSAVMPGSVNTVVPNQAVIPQAGGIGQ
jgi:hypothetical protein